MSSSRDRDYDRWQIILIAVVLLVLLGALGLYFGDISPRRIWIGWDGQTTGERVGSVLTVEGKLKRQPKDSLEFINVRRNSDLYDDDTLMTGAEDHAEVKLMDGEILALEPGSLVRLSFDSAATLGGIQRKVYIDVVSGDVKQTASRPRSRVVVRKGPTISPRPAPSPPVKVASQPIPIPSPSLEPLPSASPSASLSPSPLPPSGKGLHIIAPKNGSTLAIANGKRPPLRANVSFSSDFEPEMEVVVSVKTSYGQETSRKKVKMKAGRGSATVQFDEPGPYQVELLSAEGQPFTDGVKQSFRVASDFVAIDTLPPLVAGESIDSNVYRGKSLRDFDVTLHWKDFDDAEEYRVKVTNTKGSALVDEKVTGPRYRFPKGEVYREPIYYQISTQLPSGYIAVSARREFAFNFLSPQLTLPKDGAAVSALKLFGRGRGGLLFTWQRTSFTTGYEFELATDADFTHLIKTAKVRENLIVFNELKPGDYYWRVRSTTAQGKSPPGPPFKITVTE